MPALIAVLKFFATNLLGWVLAGAGFAFVSYQGIDLAAQQLINGINDRLTSLPPSTLDVLRLMGIPQALSLWLSGALTGMTVTVSKLMLTKL